MQYIHQIVVEIITPTPKNDQESLRQLVKSILGPWCRATYEGEFANYEEEETANGKS